MKIELVGRDIPRKPNGDPAFTAMTGDLNGTIPLKGVFDVFSGEEVVELVNRAVYQLEYQHQAHKQRAQRQRDAERPVKLMVRRMFNVPWSKATDEQIRRAADAVQKEAEG